MESNIRKLRKERSVSQAELGDAVGASQQSISRMEINRSRIRVDTLIALADYFQVSTDMVLGYQPEEKNAGEKVLQRGEDCKLEGAEHLAVIKQFPIPDTGQSTVYDLLLSMKRCLEEYGI
ncbi:MAG: helix-turn-helix domain-containing protein [Clostridiales bacterium]|nr:helix-turn-helix domain-containing protein [Clostridiales bacterium]